MNTLLCGPFSVSVSESEVWEDRESIIRDVWALSQRRESDRHMKQDSELRTGLSWETYVWGRKALFFFVVALPLIHSPFGSLV